MDEKEVRRLVLSVSETAHQNGFQAGERCGVVSERIRLRRITERIYSPHFARELIRVYDLDSVEGDL